jgi:flavin-dependent dehydrogenase
VEGLVNEVFDVAVIGGGPAGTSAAITAADLGFKVVLLEAGSFPRHKVCGEFVSGEALSLLARLRRTDDLVVSALPISIARIFLDDRVLQLPVRPAAASISRHDLDNALWNAASARGIAARERSRVKQVRPANDYFSIQLDGEELIARSVINASGRWSNLRSQKSQQEEQWIGLKAHFREAQPSTSCDLYFFEGGYCGVQPLGDGLVNGAAMVKSNIARSLQAVLSLNSALRARSSEWELAMAPVSTAPVFFRPPKTSEEGMILAGDAAAFIDPFAGDGISMALHSGRLAALALASYLSGECSLQSAMDSYDRSHRELIQPALRNARRLRRLLRLPKTLRITAMSLLKFPLLAQAAVQETRVRH